MPPKAFAGRTEEPSDLGIGLVDICYRIIA
jgi:hypothetical protein